MGGGKDRESGRRNGKEDWDWGREGKIGFIRIVEERENRKRDEVVRERAYGAEEQVGGGCV